MLERPEPTWVRDAAALEECAKCCANAPWIAVDTESNSMHVFKERVCLIQINADGELFLIDPIALGTAEPTTLAPLKPVLEDPDKRCWLHGGEYDVACFKRDYDIAIQGIWDSQQAAICLGHPRTGYGSLVMEYLEVELPKGHSQYNWGTRPIDSEAIDYALDDVWYLPLLCEMMQEKIAESNLVEECSLFNQGVEDTRSHHGGTDADYLRIKGAKRLSAAKRVVLKGLYEWRNEQAEIKDVPPGKILNNDLIMQLATVGPTNFGSLKRIRMRAWQLKDYGQELLEVIKVAKRVDPSTLPPFQSASSPLKKN